MFYFFLFLQFIVLFASASSSEVCYGKYGCFNNNGPFRRFVLGSLVPLPLPQSPSKVGTKFYLESKASSVEIDDSDVATLKASSFDGSKKTIIIVHGWTGSAKSKWILEAKAVLLDKEDVNLIITDWKEGANEILYYPSVANTRLVGAQVAELIKFLNRETKNSPASFHLIGFSLGAHVVGYAGRRLKEVKVGRITGLDPAGPYFYNEHVDVRLDETDATFVDAIHTDAGALGMTTRSGHFDFYPNNGRSQPGCQGILSGISSITCDHLRAPALFIESIASQCPFRSYRCLDWGRFTRGECKSCDIGCPEMGYNAINYKELASGTFYLHTNKGQPYCVHEYVYVTVKTRSGWSAEGLNPKIRIYGTSGRNSGTIELKKGQLAAGSTNYFFAPVKNDLGTATSIEVWNDYPFIGWSLGKVILQVAGNYDCSYTAVYKTWIRTSPVKRTLVKSGSNC